VWPLFSSSTLGWRFNFDGIVFYDPLSEHILTRSYVQIFRSGALEAVSGLVEAQGRNAKLISGLDVEYEVIKGVDSFFSLLGRAGVEPPIVVMLSLLGVKGYRISYGQFSDTQAPIEKTDILLPDVVAENYSAKTADLLRPVFDVVWQSAGWKGSCNYDKDGNWIGT
jgi:hypothetical protein